MNTLKFMITAVLAVIWGMNSFAQSHDHSKMTSSKTETIKVYGNCDLCKARIERAAKLDGVSKVEWNSKTKLLSLVYNPSMVSSDAVLKKIAAAGHDSERFKADDKVYNSLVSCCRYERK